MGDHQGPEELEIIVLPAQARSKVQAVEVVGHRLPLLRLDPGEQVAGDVAPDEVAGTEVPQSHEQVEVAVPSRYESILAEHDCLPSVGRLRELGKHDARHAGLDDDSHDTLS